MAQPTVPQRGQSRGYYSPNARIQEGYYQGNNISVVIVIKTSIANAIYFVSKNRRIGVIKVAQALISSLASTTKSLNRVKKAFANAIGYIVPKRIDHFFRYSTARIANLAIAKKTYKGTRVAISTSINLALNSKSVRRIKTSISTFINLALNSKSTRRIKTSISTFINLALNSKSVRRIKNSKANAIGYIVPKRIDHFFRYSTARLAAVIKSNKILSLTAKVIVTSLAKTARRFGKSIKVVLAPSALFTRKRTQNKKAIAIQVVSATITRKTGPKRSAGVIVTYQIGTSKRKTMYRKAIANAVGLYKYSLKRIANIRTQEAGTVQPVSQINNYVITNNNLDDVGDYSASVSETSVYYTEADDASAGNFNISTDNPAITYTEPDFPSGEDVIPT